MLDAQIKTAIYNAITQSSGDQKAIEQAMDEIHSDIATEILGAILDHDVMGAMTPEQITEEVNPIFEQLAEDFNEILTPYSITLKAWDTKALVRRIEYLAGEGQN